MRNYEAMYILRADLEEEALEAAVARFDDVVKSNNGEIVKTERWGKRRLAYEVNGKTEGYYILMTFKAPNNVSNELDRILKIQDDVLRHLVIKKDA